MLSAVSQQPTCRLILHAEFKVFNGLLQLVSALHALGPDALVDMDLAAQRESLVSHGSGA